MEYVINRGMVSVRALVHLRELESGLALPTVQQQQQQHHRDLQLVDIDLNLARVPSAVLMWSCRCGWIGEVWNREFNIDVFKHVVMKHFIALWWFWRPTRRIKGG